MFYKLNSISALAAAFAMTTGVIQVGTNEAMAFTAEQAESGKKQYDTQCAVCHGFSLEGPEAPALVGSDVMQNFDTGSGLYDYFSVAMPPQAPGQLGEKAYVDILAYILQFNGAKADSTELSADPGTLDALKLAAVTAGGAASGGSQAQQETASKDAPAVPQAFTFGKTLPTVGASEASASSAVPQAYTFGKKLPTAN